MKNKWLENLKNYLESEEGKKVSEEYFNKLNIQEKILESQIERFVKKYSNNFSIIVDKIIEKYNSREYVLREYRCGYQPRESLYFFLFEMVRKYGISSEFNGDFCIEAYNYQNYHFELWNGQGSCIIINKINDV